MKTCQAVPFTDVRLDDGFWRRRQDVNAARTIYSIRDRFADTGRFDAWRFDWQPGKPNRPHIFWDSDVAKWIEAAACILIGGAGQDLVPFIDELIERIAVHQDENGYFNTYFTVVEPGGRWQKRTEHELYCIGHLIEAAIAYHRATGKDRMLALVKRMAAHVEQVFLLEHSATFETPGHEEIELALVRLYEHTGEQRWLALARHFVDRRGSDKPEQYYPWANARYAQDHAPVRCQDSAQGHAVRAMYLYCAMADLAREDGDEGLLTACRNIFDDILRHKMYLTGAIGSSGAGEAFTVAYDLPNATAYAETCAAIGLALFARRMLLIDMDSRYADTAERVLYNAMLSGISLDGRRFFYENPLELNPALRHRDVSVKDTSIRYPIPQRVEVFDCSCCPPNLARVIAALGDNLYTRDDHTLYVHHYAAGRVALPAWGPDAGLAQRTGYPWDGRIILEARGMAGKTLALRIPGWCRQYALTVDGAPADPEIIKGYACVRCRTELTLLELNLAMEPTLYAAHPAAQDDAGRVALMRGPVVYCLEGVDNGPLLKGLAVDRKLRTALVWDEELGLPVLEADGWRPEADEETPLYQPYTDDARPVRLRFIPYFAFANRGENPMLVWVGVR